MFRRLTNIFLTLVIFGFLTFFVPIIIDELFGFRLELDRTNIYFIYIYLLILYYFVIFIHEIGHLTLGCFCKFKFHLLHVGPLIYYKDGRRKQLLITTNELLGGTSGMYISNTKDTKYLRIKHFFYTLGGYLFNIFGALLSLTILSIAEFSSESFNFIVQTFFIFNISLVIFPDFRSSK
ncbi:hypothetical protein GCM10022410_06050 [Amphibacillus indicireducens]|uniref:Peptidase M50 domain-containing protein n=1 Tax=Amphibacillus indicireducens TaxID=1076330 RepID=A0ABP7V8I7_9BACI